MTVIADLLLNRCHIGGLAVSYSVFHQPAPVNSIEARLHGIGQRPTRVRDRLLVFPCAIRDLGRCFLFSLPVASMVLIAPWRSSFLNKSAIAMISFDD